MDAGNEHCQYRVLGVRISRDAYRKRRYASRPTRHNVSPLSRDQGYTVLTCSVGVMIAAPPEKAGVVGATLQTSMHTSTVLALSIQAGLLTTQPGGLENYANIRASWYFELGWVVLWLVGFLVFYRPARNAPPVGIDDVLV
jgi:hypothetical protein